jgi:ribosomal protein S14
MAARSADSSASRSCQLRNEANLPLAKHRPWPKATWTAAALLPLSAKQPCCEHVFRSPTSQIRKTPPSAHRPSTLAKGHLDCGSPAAAFREAALLRACLRSPTSQIRKTPPSAHQPSTLAKGHLDCGSPAAAFREAALLRACLHSPTS